MSEVILLSSMSTTAAAKALPSTGRRAEVHDLAGSAVENAGAVAFQQTAGARTS
jgi:uncharacterized membrane protein